MGLGSLGNLGKLMKQVQKMQEEMARLQTEAEQKVVEATAGGGAVKVTANGKGELVAVAIQPEAIDPADPAFLEDLILAAANEALRQAKESVSQEMARLYKQSGLPAIPGMQGLF
ncbi:MAG: YbaB/EbfC family nucleoid-associated protein [Bacillota bacterium]|nr:YbaB/EbfC family nucleoid-associated protein [Bacillota bacterium]